MYLKNNRIKKMDLRSLINKLDNIEQQKLLLESEQLMEKVRIRYSDVEAVAKQYPTDEVARGQALAKLAKEHGLPGLFDPVSRELVNPDGSLSTFKGADEATVNQLQNWGLLPLGAKTSSWLGFRGRDEKTAIGANQSAQSRDALTDKANELMDKAVQAAVAPAPVAASGASGQSANESTLFTSGIASALIEEFGFNGIELLESVTPAEHTELKKIVQDLTKAAPSDPDVVEVTTNYKNYVKQRDQIINRIKELIQVIKSKPVAKSVTESLEDTEKRMIAEGRIQILEDGKRYLRDGLEWTYNPATELYSHLNEDGTLTELDKKQFYSDAGDFARGVGNGLTLDYGDNISAGIQALFTDKTYKDALKAELAKTEKSKKDSPWLYYGGNLAGFMANPLSKIGLGLPGTLGKLTTGVPLMAVQAASSHFVREPLNAYALGADGKPVAGQGAMDKNSIIAMQKELKAKGANLGTTGPKKDGIDGAIGKLTRQAMAKYPEIAKKYSSAGKVKAITPAAAAAPVEAPSAEEAPAAAVADASADMWSGKDASGKTVMKGSPADVTSTQASTSAAASANTTVIDKVLGTGHKGLGSNAVTPSSAPAVNVDIVKVKSMVADIQQLAKQKGFDFYTAMNQYANTANLSEGIQLTVDQQQYLTEMNSIRRLSGLPLLTEAPMPPIAGELAGKAGETVWNALKGGWNALKGGGEAAAQKAAAEATAVKAAKDAKLAQQMAEKAAADEAFRIKQAADAARAKAPALQTATDRLALQAEKQAAEKAASGAVVSGAEKAAVASTEKAAVAGAEGAAEKGLITRFGGKAGAALEKLKSIGGKVLSFMGNNKFLTLAAMIGAAGFIFGPDGVEETATGTSDGSASTQTAVVPDKDGKCPTGYKLSADGKKCEKVEQGGQEATPVAGPAPDLSELQKLVDQLYSGWPTDPETAAALALAKEAGAKVPAVGQGAMTASGSSSSSSVSNFAQPLDFRAGMRGETSAREAGKQ